MSGIRPQTGSLISLESRVVSPHISTGGNAHVVFRSDEQRSQEQTRIAELERLAGRLTLELEVAKKVSQSLGAALNRSER